MSIQLLMAQKQPSIRGGSGTGRSAGLRNGANASHPPLDTGVTGQPQASPPASFQGLGQETLQEYTNQLTYLEEQNRLRRQIAYDERRQIRSQPRSPTSPRAAHAKWAPYPSEPSVPRSAVDPRVWYGSESEFAGWDSTSESTRATGSSGGVFSAGGYGASGVDVPTTSMSGSQSAVDPIQQYQQMLRGEQQRRIKEMEETRRQRERERLKREAQRRRRGGG